VPGAQRAGLVTVARMCVAGPGMLVVAGYEDGGLRVWDPRAPAAPLLTQALHAEPVMALALDGRARRGASGASDARVRHFLLNLPAGTCSLGAVHSAASAEAAGLAGRGVADLTFRAEGRLLAAAGWDGRVRLYDAVAAAPLASLRYHAAAVAAVAFSGDARGTLASGARDGTVALWEVYPPS